MAFYSSLLEQVLREVQVAQPRRGAPGLESAEAVPLQLQGLEAWQAQQLRQQIVVGRPPQGILCATQVRKQLHVL